MAKVTDKNKYTTGAVFKGQIVTEIIDLQKGLGISNKSDVIRYCIHKVWKELCEKTNDTSQN